MRYTLRQLEVFLAVARGQSVSGAARTLFMSQSAVSGALGDLEKQFDVRLFDRVGKRLRLSAFGQSLRPRAEAVFDQAGHVEEALASGKDTGRLRIGATVTIGSHLAVPLMARFLRAHAGADISLVVANTAAIARQVANFELDIGLVEGEIEHRDLAATPWRDDALVVFCAPDHALARKRALSDADLVRAAWVVRELGSGTRQTFDRAMTGLLPGLHIALALAHTEAIKHAVRAGLGLGCLSRLAIDDELRRGVFKTCRVPQRDFRRQFYFLLHKQKYQSPSLDAWLALCRAHGRG